MPVLFIPLDSHLWIYSYHVFQLDQCRTRIPTRMLNQGSCPHTLTCSPPAPGGPDTDESQLKLSEDKAGMFKSMPLRNYGKENTVSSHQGILSTAHFLAYSSGQVVRPWKSSASSQSLALPFTVYIWASYLTSLQVSSSVK